MSLSHHQLSPYLTGEPPILAVEKYLRAIKNFSLISLLLFEYLVKGWYYKKTIKDPVAWRKKAIHFVSNQCKRMLRNVNFDVSYNYSRPDLFANDKKYFMVCNHMSYMDILFLSSGEPSVFVTSVEMRETPFLGECSVFGGCYFVERRDRSKIPGEVKDLANILKQGFHVFVFPEATSTHGMHILPFKKSMFSAAVEAGYDVLPICLKYEEVDGKPFNEFTKDKLCWYGDMGFVPHFAQIMTLKSVKVSINYLEPISVKEYPDRSQLAEKAYQQITQVYFADRDPSFKPWPLPEKK